MAARSVADQMNVVHQMSKQTEPLERKITAALANPNEGSEELAALDRAGTHAA